MGWKKILLVFLVLGFLSSAAQAAERITWVWDKRGMVDSIVRLSGEREKFLNFLANPHGLNVPVHTIYLDAKAFLVEGETDRLADFIDEMHRHRIKVYYLDGDPAWAVAYQSEALGRVEAVLNFNKKYDRNKNFDGIVFDIEPYLLIASEIEEEPLEEEELSPYLLPKWKSARAEVEKKYLTLLKNIMAKTKGKIPFGAAVPLLFGESELGKKSLGDKVLDAVDFIALMDYRDMALRIIRDGRPFVVRAGEIKKKVIIGVETIDLEAAGEGENASTFAEEGWQYMEKELDKIEEAFSPLPGFGGIAIHYYNSYRSLQEEDTNRPLVKVPLFKAKKAGRIKLDGSLEEWGQSSPIEIKKRENVVYQAERRWRGPDDLSALAYVLWDNQNVYLAVKVKDNKLVVTSKGQGEKMWKEDHIEVWFGPDAAANALNIIDVFQLGLSPGDFAKLGPSACLWVPENLSNGAENIQVAAKKLKNGYIVEARIPVKILGLEKLKKGSVVRFSVDPSDTDDPRAKQEILMSPTKRVWGKPGTLSKLILD